MNSLSSDLLSVLGKQISDSDVNRVIADNGFFDIFDDPPFSQYIGAKVKGVDLLFEEGQLVDIQFFVQATKLYSAFADALPFGLKAGMSQQQVHHILGKPDVFHDSDSRYFLKESNLRLVIAYDSVGIIRYLSVALPMQ